MKTKERFEEWFSTVEEDFKKYKWLQWMNDIQEEYLSWYNDLRDNTIEETEEWSTRDDENLEKWALYEEYIIFEDAYYEYESDWVRELQEKWEEQNDENEIIKPTEN